MESSRSRALWLVVIASVFATAFVQARKTPPPSRFVAQSPAPAPAPAPAGGPLPFTLDRHRASSGTTLEVHAASAVEARSGGIRAFWYGGTREGARDVAIYSAVFDPSSHRWSPDRVITTREATSVELGRYVRKLGNPMVMADGSARLWLFYVSVTVGGWSGSAINVKVSDDEGESWSDAKRLVSSPFSNISTLVRGPGVFFEDGTLGLPVYHELIGKFAELLRVDREGDVLSKTRITWGRSLHQPVLVPLSGRTGVALFRQSRAPLARIHLASTSDAGRSFGPPEATSLRNPDAGIAAIRTGERELLVAFNDSEVDRSNLKLAQSKDGGKSWRIVYEVRPPHDAGGSSPRLAYPTLVLTSRDELHLLYTWDRKEIRHLHFRGAWRDELDR